MKNEEAQVRPSDDEEERWKPWRLASVCIQAILWIGRKRSERLDKVDYQFYDIVFLSLSKSVRYKS